jgi:hypothetical protein
MFPIMWAYGFPQIPPAMMFDVLSADEWESIIYDFATIFSVAGIDGTMKTDPMDELNAHLVLSTFSKLDKYSARKAVWEKISAVETLSGGGDGKKNVDIMGLIFNNKQRGGGGMGGTNNGAGTSSGPAVIVPAPLPGAGTTSEEGTSGARPSVIVSAPLPGAGTGLVRAPGANFAALTGAATQGAMAIAGAAARGEISPASMLAVVNTARTGYTVQQQLATIENQSRILIQTMTGEFTAAKVGEQVKVLKAKLMADAKAVREIIPILAKKNFKSSNLDKEVSWFSEETIRGKLSENALAIVNALITAKGKLSELTTALNQEHRRLERLRREAASTVQHHLCFIGGCAATIIGMYYSNAVVAGFASDAPTDTESLPFQQNLTQAIIVNATAAAAGAALNATASAASSARTWVGWASSGFSSAVEGVVAVPAWAISSTATAAAKGLFRGTYAGIVGVNSTTVSDVPVTSVVEPSRTWYQVGEQAIVPALTFVVSGSLLYTGAQALNYWKLSTELSEIKKAQAELTERIFEQLFIAIITDYECAIHESFLRLARLTQHDSSRAALLMATESVGGLEDFISSISTEWINLTGKRNQGSLVTLIGETEYLNLMTQLDKLVAESARSSRDAIDLFRAKFRETKTLATQTINAPISVARSIVGAVSASAVGLAQIAVGMANPAAALMSRVLATSAAPAAPIAPSTAAPSTTAAPSSNAAPFTVLASPTPGSAPVTQAQLLALIEALTGRGAGPHGLRSAADNVFVLAGLPPPRRNASRHLALGNEYPALENGSYPTNLVPFGTRGGAHRHHRTRRHKMSNRNTRRRR